MEQKMNILFTLKIKGTSNDFQDNIEVETFACDDNKDIANKITKYIKNQINIQIPNEIFNMDQLCDILKKLERIGLVPYNIVEKKRKEFVGRKAKVLFDEFPNPVGTYLEIEAGNETDLFDTIKQLGLEDKRLDKRNYGRIIAEATNGASKCLFDSKI